MRKHFNQRGFVMSDNDAFTTSALDNQQDATKWDFTKLKVGKNIYKDPLIDLDYFGDFHRTNPRCADKKRVIDAIQQQDLAKLREISEV